MIVSASGADLFYATRGQGPTCLVLSSIGTAPYELMMPRQLSDRLRLVFVDLRGGGRSTGDAGALTFDMLADDLEAIRLDLGLERVAVLGHSIMGVPAIEYGRRRPGSVSHVITVGTPPRGDMAQLAARATQFFEEDASDERKRILRGNLAALPPGTPVGQAVLAQGPLRFFDPTFDAGPLFAEAVLKPILMQRLLGPLTSAWDVTVGAETLRTPLLLVHGRYDYVVPHVLWEGIPARLPNATFQLFDHSSHHPFLEEPDHFASTVTEWMSRHP